NTDASHPLRAGNKKSWPTTVIGFDLLDNPLVSDEDFVDLLRLPVAKLQHDPAGRAQMPCAFRSQPSKKIKSVRAAVQRGAWIVIPHLRRQRVNLCARNVRRVRHDQVERQTLRQRGEPVSEVELNAAGDAMKSGIFAGNAYRLRRNIHGVHPGGGTSD